jgi:hypothetical protein
MYGTNGASSINNQTYKVSSVGTTATNGGRGITIYSADVY